VADGGDGFFRLKEVADDFQRARVAGLISANVALSVKLWPGFSV
jgi:hypothetical protein